MASDRVALEEVVENEPAYLTVRKTFLEVVPPVKAYSHSRRRSEPEGFKPAAALACAVAGGAAAGEGEGSGSSTPSTVVSEDDSSEAEEGHAAERAEPGANPPSTPKLVLPGVMLRSGSMASSFASFGVGADSDDGEEEEERTPEYVMRTPSTMGQRTPEPSAKKVSFAYAEAPQDAEVLPRSRTASCLSRPRLGSRSSPTTPARRVSFALEDDVISIDPAPAGASQLAVPQGAAQPAQQVPAPRSRLSSSAKPWMSASIGPSAPLPKPSALSIERGTAPDAYASYEMVVETARMALAACSHVVTWAEAKEGPRGWTIIGYVHPSVLGPWREYLLAVARQALYAAADASDKVFLLGYAANPFTPMPFGFGTALAHMPDKDSACWSSFAQGFCSNPSACCGVHPKCQVGINVMIKPARARR